jgi:hypothetical protein
MSVESNSSINVHINRSASSSSSRITKLTIPTRRAAENDAMPRLSTTTIAIAPSASRQHRLSLPQASCQRIVSIANCSQPPPTHERDQDAPQAQCHSTCPMTIESNSSINVLINQSTSSSCARITKLTITPRRVDENEATPTLSASNERTCTKRDTTMTSFFAPIKHSTHCID